MTCTFSRVTRTAEESNSYTVFRSSLFKICSKLEMVVEICPEGFWVGFGNHISKAPVIIFAIKMLDFLLSPYKIRNIFWWNSLRLVQWGDFTVPCWCLCALVLKGQGQPSATVHKLISIYIKRLLLSLSIVF